jgi:hypothetical protein
MAEDLFAADRLRGVVLADGTWLETRRLREVEAWMDHLARLRPGAIQQAGSKEQGARTIRNVITFAPDGTRGVAAYVEGSKIASA